MKGGPLGTNHSLTPMTEEQSDRPAKNGHLNTERGDHPFSMAWREGGDIGRRLSHAMKPHSRSKKMIVKSTGMVRTVFAER